MEKWSITVMLDNIEKLVKQSQEKYRLLLNEIRTDLKFLEFNWLKGTPVIDGLMKKYFEKT